MRIRSFAIAIATMLAILSSGFWLVARAHKATQAVSRNASATSATQEISSANTHPNSTIAVPLQVPSLVADYQFRDSLSSSTNNPPALTNLGNNTFEGATVDDSLRRTLHFDQNNGVAFTPTTGLVPSQSYTVVLLFAFTDVTSYRRILDFKNGTNESGLYNLDGRLSFHLSPFNDVVSNNVTITPSAFVQVVLTRESAGNVSGYVNGVRQFSFTDSANNAAIDFSNTLRFFRTHTGSNSASAGSVVRLRLYNAALSGSQIAALDRLPNQQTGCPSVSYLNPASGVPGNSFNINGAGLAGITGVKFPNNITAQFTVNNDAQLTVTVPNGAATGTLTLSKPNCGNVQTSAVFAISNISSPPLVTDYQFSDSLSSVINSPPALTNLGNNTFENVTIDDSLRRGLRFDRNDGLALFSTDGVVSNQAYSVVLLFTFNETSGARRILDFKNGTNESGLYISDGRLNFHLSPFNDITGNNVTITPNTFVQVVFTRNAAGNVNGYVNGVQQFAFADSANAALIEANTLRFFRTHVTSVSNSSSAGRIVRLRLYGVALSSNEVAALDRLPPPPPVAIVSAASFTGAMIASESIAAAFGTALATCTQTATARPLPTSLCGTTVKVKDSLGVERLAPLFFVAPPQINFQIPPGTAIGTAQVTVTNGNGLISVGTAPIVLVAPGLFTANANGQGVAAAVALRVKAGGAQTFELIARLDTTINRFVTTPIDLGPLGEQVFLILYGTGIRFRSTLSTVTVKIGGVDAPVSFAQAQGSLIGLDQINALIPRSLIGRGEVDVTLTVEGKAANTVRVNIK